MLAKPETLPKIHRVEQLRFDKAAVYAALKPRLLAALQEAKDFQARCQIAVDWLHASLPHFHWTGIYLLEDDTLVLGPYHGKHTEHTHIPVGRGICGRAVAEQRSIVVDDVTKESNYLACSLETRSEIVVPIVQAGKIIGEIDVDSDLPGAFDQLDREFLELLCSQF